MSLFSGRTNRPRALSDSSQASGGHGCLILFGLVFAGFGSMFVMLFFVLPLWRALDAAKWIEVPCTILASKLGESSDSDGGTTYRVEVSFRYHFSPGALEADPTSPSYESTRYDFSDGTYTSGSSSKREEVERLTPGTQTTCRVNPVHSADAVLHGGLPADLWFGLIPLIFPLVGLTLMVVGFRGMRRARLQREGRLPLSASTSRGRTPIIPNDDDNEPVELQPAQSRVAKLVFLIIFSAFWNGIVWSIMGFAILPGLFKGGLFEWFPFLFLSLFALIGLFLIGAVFHQLLALTNPRLRLTVNRRSLRPGDVLGLEWECAGNPSRVSHLIIALEGRESATYTRGTDTTTDTHVFAKMILATLDDPAAILSGRATFQIPLATAPTFVASNNKIEWLLTVRGIIPRWPDISDDYTVTVLPPKSTP